jgi:hypothetical protein
MSSNVQDPSNMATSSYTIMYSEKIRLAMTVLSMLNDDEWNKLQSALAASPHRTVPDIKMEYNPTSHTTMVQTGPLITQCPYCGRG